MKRLVIGNWKMNPATATLAQKLVKGITEALKKDSRLSAIIAPPFPFLSVVGKLHPRLSLAAQSLSHKKEGPYTGEVSATMLRSLGVSCVIVGHSERRALGETDEMINLKVLLALKEKISPIICVGEKERDTHGKYFSIVEEQLTRALLGVSKVQLAHVVIAYEPVWAISKGDGKGETATPEHAHEMKLFIQKVLVSLYGRQVAMKVPVIYGGSVNPQNVEELAEKSEADGFLVGGASVNVDSFITILKAAHHE